MTKEKKSCINKQEATENQSESKESLTKQK